MSATYDTVTFFVESEFVPQALASGAELEKLSGLALSQAERDPSDWPYIRSKQEKGALNYVRGSTRNGWAIYTLTEILESTSFSSLKFLAASGHKQVFAAECGENRVSVLSGEEQEQVISEMHRFLSFIAQTPEVVTLAAGGCCSDDEVVKALQKDNVSARPAFDLNVAGDEGVGDDYLFVYLRSILAVLENANKRGLATTHVLNYPS